MKIRVAIIEQDENYVRRLVNNWQINYADKLEIYSFSSFEIFQEFVRNNYVSVILASEEIKIDTSKLPERASFAYLVSNKGVEEIDGQPAVCKFQKVDLLYKNVLSLFADKEKNLIVKSGMGSNHVVLFTSAQGGVGTSVLASAFAVSKAKQGNKVLFLSMDKLQQMNICFTGEGTMSFSDAIYAIKSRRANLSMKLESIIKSDKTGVDFFDTVRNANDMLSINEEDVDLLFKAVSALDGYQYIVIDAPLDFTPICQKLLKEFAREIVIVNDGSEIGNIKLQRVMEVLDQIEKDKKGSIVGKCKMLYNRFSSATGQKLQGLSIGEVGGINRIEGASYEQLVNALSEHPIVAGM